jgi:hypothetical protein
MLTQPEDEPAMFLVEDGLEQNLRHAGILRKV